MIKTMRRYTQTTPNVFLITITCITTLLLFFGSLIFHISNFAPFSLAHAATTCASTKGTQQEVCEQQNPVVQGCMQDGHVLELQSVYTAQNELIGTVSLLHSAICKTYWIRTIAYANTRQIEAIDAIISFQTGKVEDIKKIISANGIQIMAITNMIFVLPNLTPTNWAGKFFLKGQTQPITIPI